MFILVLDIDYVLCQLSYLLYINYWLKKFCVWLYVC